MHDFCHCWAPTQTTSSTATIRKQLPSGYRLPVITDRVVRGFCTLRSRNGAVSCLDRTGFSSGFAVKASRDWQLFTDEGVGADKIEWTGIVDSMDDEDRAGSPEVMTAVLTLGDFSWTYCTANNCVALILKASHEKVKKHVEPVVVGPNVHKIQGPISRSAIRSAAVSGSSPLPLSPRASHSYRFSKKCKRRGRSARPQCAK